MNNTCLLKWLIQRGNRGTESKPVVLFRPFNTVAYSSNALNWST